MNEEYNDIMQIENILFVYVASNTTRVKTFFYHSDHLGSTSYITDAKANITQFDAYLPYGELLVDEHSSSEEMPYKFNGKELDEETGLYYYGARYMDPKISMWLGVDPLMEQTPSWTPYRAFYCNPIRYTDLIGLSESTHTDDNGNVIAVFNDNDNGVYKHGKNADGSNPTEYQLSKRAEKFGTSSGGIRMGEQNIGMSLLVLKQGRL